MAGRVAWRGHPVYEVPAHSGRANRRTVGPKPLPSLIMVTTIRNTEYITIANDRHVEPGLSCWGSLKDRFAAWFYTSAFCNALCCTSADEEYNLRIKRMHRVSVQRSLMENMDYYGKSSIIEAVIDDVRLDGYDMVKDDEPRRTMREWDALFARLGLDPLVATDAELKRASRREIKIVRAVPRFTAAVVVAVRSRVGQLSKAVPGNLLIVEREALRLMRKYNVREVDCVAHMPRIIGAYFNCDIHYIVETAESRMSRFHRWLKGVPDPPATFAPLA